MREVVAAPAVTFTVAGERAIAAHSHGSPERPIGQRSEGDSARS